MKRTVFLICTFSTAAARHSLYSADFQVAQTATAKPKLQTKKSLKKKKQKKNKRKITRNTHLK